MTSLVIAVFSRYYHPLKNYVSSKQSGMFQLQKHTFVVLVTRIEISCLKLWPALFAPGLQHTLGFFQIAFCISVWFTLSSCEKSSKSQRMIKSHILNWRVSKRLKKQFKGSSYLNSDIYSGFSFDYNFSRNVGLNFTLQRWYYKFCIRHS